MIWFDLVLWHINQVRLLNAKSSLYIYIRYMISKQILEITSLNDTELTLLQLNSLISLGLRHINLCRLFNAKSIFIQIFQTIQFSMSTQFNYQKLFFSNNSF